MRMTSIRSSITTASSTGTHRSLIVIVAACVREVARMTDDVRVRSEETQ